MSMYHRLKKWDDVIGFLKDVDYHPQCFTVNYLPETEEYSIWIGNQPYHSYEKLIELEEKEHHETKKKLEIEIKNLKSEIDSLQKLLS
ncbi:hypothetical protein [Bacillus sp. MZGC1]|uniref:hypothetical protein n=1 Tax=Bacillus sp. MZGC1 TaxID=2108543 RepID=UPI000D022449|nr:hypothetical protein [Bacillus sp. MZGC1]PRS47530.1 hypothetical protein C6Y06_18440 [Bacillus sp. MZGC1]